MFWSSWGGVGGRRTAVVEVDRDRVRANEKTSPAPTGSAAVTPRGAQRSPGTRSARRALSPMSRTLTLIRGREKHDGAQLASKTPSVPERSTRALGRI